MWEVKFHIHGIDISMHFQHASYVIKRRWLTPVYEDIVVSVHILNGHLGSSGLHLHLRWRDVMHCHVLRQQTLLSMPLAFFHLNMQ